MIRLQAKTFSSVFLFISLILLAACAQREPTAEETLAEAESFLAAGEFRAAIDRLEAFDERQSGHPQIIESLAEAYAADDDFTLAAFQYLRLAEQEQADPVYLLFAAGAFREAGDHVGAIRTYEEYLVRNPEDTPVWRTLGQLHRERGDRQQAIDAFLQSNRRNPEGATQVAIGQLFLAGNNLAQAQSWFASAAEEEDEARPEAFLGLIETALAANRPGDAEALLRQMDDEFPGFFDRSALGPQRARLIAWRERQDEARREAEALARVRRQAREEAERRARETAMAEAADQDDPRSGTEVTAEERGLPTSADKFRGVEDREGRRAGTTERRPRPTPEPSHLERADRYLREGDADAAIAAYRQALREDRDNPAVWSGLSEAQLQAGQPDWAQASASEAIRRDPGDPTLTMQFLRAANQALPPERFVREVQRARERFPESPDITFTLARAYEESIRDPRSARLLYQRFLELAGPDHPQRPHAEAALRRP